MCCDVMYPEFESGNTRACSCWLHSHLQKTHQIGVHNLVYWWNNLILCYRTYNLSNFRYVLSKLTQCDRLNFSHLSNNYRFLSYTAHESINMQTGQQQRRNRGSTVSIQPEYWLANCGFWGTVWGGWSKDRVLSVSKIFILLYLFSVFYFF
jgi:hypothetical protein